MIFFMVILVPCIIISIFGLALTLGEPRVGRVALSMAGIGLAGCLYVGVASMLTYDQQVIVSSDLYQAYTLKTPSGHTIQVAVGDSKIPINLTALSGQVFSDGKVYRIVKEKAPSLGLCWLMGTVEWQSEAIKEKQ